MDAVFPDLSDHNTVLNDAVISEWRKWSGWVSFRSNDGTYSDKNFSANSAWTVKRDKQIIGKINYLVFPPSENNATWQETASLFLLRLRTTGSLSKTVAMIDVESWGRWHKDMSRELNLIFIALFTGINSMRPNWQKNTYGLRRYFRMMDRRRVIGYGNAGDLDTLWPKKPKRMRIVLANYSSNTRYPGEVIHQYSSTYQLPGLGLVDVNSADGYSPKRLARKLGLVKLTRSVL